MKNVTSLPSTEVNETPLLWCGSAGVAHGLLFVWCQWAHCYTLTSTSTETLNPGSSTQTQSLQIKPTLHGTSVYWWHRWDNACRACNRTRYYLLVTCASEGVLDRMRWVSALLAAEVPLAGGVARATGHPGSVLAGCCYFTDQRPFSLTRTTWDETGKKKF